MQPRPDIPPGGVWFYYGSSLSGAPARNETPAQDGSAYSPAGFLPFAVFTTSGLSAAFATSGPSVGIFWRLRLGASAQRSAVYLRVVLKDKGLLTRP